MLLSKDEISRLIITADPATVSSVGPSNSESNVSLASPEQSSKILTRIGMAVAGALTIASLMHSPSAQASDCIGNGVNDTIESIDITKGVTGRRLINLGALVVSGGLSIVVQGAAHTLGNCDPETRPVTNVVTQGAGGFVMDKLGIDIDKPIETKSSSSSAPRGQSFYDTGGASLMGNGDSSLDYDPLSSPSNSSNQTKGMAFS